MLASSSGDFVWKEIGVLYPGICCSRYLFLGVVAYIVLKEIPIKKIWPLIVISFVYLTYAVYVGFPSWTEPFMPYKWEQQTGPSYFYSLFLFVVLLRFFKRIEGGRTSSLICKLGGYSWEVFLMQMFLLGTDLREIVDPITENKYIETFIVIVTTLILSIVLGIVYNRLMNCVAEKLV